jgi:hypothetical protein
MITYTIQNLSNPSARATTLGMSARYIHFHHRPASAYDKGTVTFEPTSAPANAHIYWNVSGNDANAERGMHIHICEGGADTAHGTLPGTFTEDYMMD